MAGPIIIKITVEFGSVTYKETIIETKIISVNENTEVHKKLYGDINEFQMLMHQFIA